jgi:hypothetical protein
MTDKINYTFTFSHDSEGKFRNVLSRLDEGEYNIVEDVSLVKPDDGKYSNKKMVIEMEPEACLTFRLGMRDVKIRRARTEEELAEEKLLDDKNTIRITIKVNPPVP